MNPFGLTCCFENEKYRDCDRTCGGLIMKYNDDFLETKSCVPVTDTRKRVTIIFDRTEALQKYTINNTEGLISNRLSICENHATYKLKCFKIKSKCYLCNDKKGRENEETRKILLEELENKKLFLPKGCIFCRDCIKATKKEKKKSTKKKQKQKTQEKIAELQSEYGLDEIWEKENDAGKKVYFIKIHHEKKRYSKGQRNTRQKRQVFKKQMLIMEGAAYGGASNDDIIQQLKYNIKALQKRKNINIAILEDKLNSTKLKLLCKKLKLKSDRQRAELASFLKQSEFYDEPIKDVFVKKQVNTAYEISVKINEKKKKNF